MPPCRKLPCKLDCSRWSGRKHALPSTAGTRECVSDGVEDTAWVVDASAIDIEGFYSGDRPGVRFDAALVTIVL
jgi:hypothetical protein